MRSRPGGREGSGRDDFVRRAPCASIEPVAEEFLAMVRTALGLTSGQLIATAWLDNGSRWLGMLLDSGDTVRAIEPLHASLKDLCKVGVIGRDHCPSRPLFEVRAFAAYVGVPEDPVTGSLNASMAQWLMERGDAPESYVAAQGSRTGRAGRVHVTSQDGRL